MKNPKILFGSVCACLISSGQVPECRPQVAGRPVWEGQVTVVYLAPRFTTAAIPALDGEKPGTAPPGKQILKAGVSEVIDQGKQVVVLFSVVNVQDHAVELMPPQVQVGGKVKKGTIVRHSIWSNSEQLRVEKFCMSLRRIGPGERADGVLISRDRDPSSPTKHCSLRSRTTAQAPFTGRSSNDVARAWEGGM